MTEAPTRPDNGVVEKAITFFYYVDLPRAFDFYTEVMGFPLEIDQGYIPGVKVRERVRRVAAGALVRYVRTIKVGSGISRFEFEEEATEEFFAAVWPLTQGHRIRKRRYRMPGTTGTWEVDEFLDRELVLAEIELEERPSEPVLCFFADKTEPGAWNLPLFRTFADPFCSAGLVIDTKMHDGFTFEVLDLYEDNRIELTCPQELYDLLLFIGAPSRYVIRSPGVSRASRRIT